ncbi:MAG: DUF488 domain-containing protein [Hyphomicrobiales bacterium]|nr:DUF488 domain-containing protein [Hyphomicrobiales bacterium]
MTRPRILTIGYECADVLALISALRSAGVTRVVDIRHSPYSRRAEFSKDELDAILGEYGIGYTHIVELGNPPAGREAARAGHIASYKSIYTAHLDGRDGQKGLTILLDLAERDCICLLCFERSANHCHRRMIADKITTLTGRQVDHLRVAPSAPHPDQHAFDFSA